MENLSSEELKSSIHEALNTFPIQVWNGEDRPKTVSLPEGMTIISQEVRNVKTDIKSVKGDIKDLKSDVFKVNEQIGQHNELLSGIKQRKQIGIYFKGIYDSLRHFTIIRIFFWFTIHASALYGLVKIIQDIFF